MINDLTISVFGRKQLNKVMPLCEALALLQDMDLLHVGELAEKAVAKKAKVSQMGRGNAAYDLANGWEIKHGQSHEKRKAGYESTQRVAYVASLENKDTTLRVIITERKTGILYYFKVPVEAYRKYRGSSISWAFDLDGTPQRQFLGWSTRPNFWDFEVANFQELCS